MIKTTTYKMMRPPHGDEPRQSSVDAAQSYWQELFDSEQLSPPEYKYLFPDLSNVENEAVKELLTYKLTEEMNLLVQADWSGYDAVGLTAFWLKILSEPKIPQLRKCKLEFVTRMVEQLATSDILSSNSSEDHTNGITDTQTAGQSQEETTQHPTADVAAVELASADMDDGATDTGVYATTHQTPSSEDNSKQIFTMNPDFTSMESQQSESLLYQEDGKPVVADDGESSTQWTVTQSGSNSVFSCNTCHYTSPYKSRIKQHMRSVHSSIRPYKCDFCDHTTAIRASLTKHINAVHRKVKPFSCHLCSYTCNLKSSLDVHLSGYHQKTYRHSCPYCDYAAAAKNVVDIHIQAVHMKEKPYKCPHCEYSSAYPQYIPKHIAAVHERKKPYACPHCDYRSSYKTYLQKHCDAVHNNIKPYSCPHCSYVTSYSQYLSKHISAVHKDEKPHKCPLCDFRCAYKQYISKHIELVHSGNRAANTSSISSNPVDSTNSGSANSWPLEDSSASAGLAAPPAKSELKTDPDRTLLNVKPAMASSQTVWPGMDNVTPGYNLQAAVPELPFDNHPHSPETTRSFM